MSHEHGRCPCPGRRAIFRGSTDGTILADSGRNRLPRVAILSLTWAFRNFPGLAPARRSRDVPWPSCYLQGRPSEGATSMPSEVSSWSSRPRCQHESKRLTIVSLSGTARAHHGRVRRGRPRRAARADPRSLPWQYFYDEHGSRLFERICGLPEYYLTRTEDAILRDHARRDGGGLVRGAAADLDRAGQRQRRQDPAADRGGACRRTARSTTSRSTSRRRSSKNRRGRWCAGSRRCASPATSPITRPPCRSRRRRSTGRSSWSSSGSSLGNYSTEEAVALLGQVAGSWGPTIASCSGPTWPRTGPPWRPPTTIRKA